MATNSFAKLAAGLPGTVGVAVAPLGEGPVQTLGPLQNGHAWSTMKVPVLVALLAEYEQNGEQITAAQGADATVALEQSDNAAAEALFGELERAYGGLTGASGAVEQVLASAGDPSTQVNTLPNSTGFTTWGQSLWSATGEVVFYRSLARGCLLAGEDTDYVLRLMRSVTPSQRWGAGEAGFPSAVPLAFKGGWGPDGGGYLVRQTAIVGSGGRGYVISMIARPASGSFAAGTSMITSLASWAHQELPLDDHSPQATCPGAQ